MKQWFLENIIDWNKEQGGLHVTINGWLAFGIVFAIGIAVGWHWAKK